jgi:hypothetical protein
MAGVLAISDFFSESPESGLRPDWSRDVIKILSFLAFMQKFFVFLDERL